MSIGFELMPIRVELGHETHEKHERVNRVNEHKN